MSDLLVVTWALLIQPPSKPPKHPDKVHSCSMASNSLPNSLSALLILVSGKVPCRLTRFQRELISWCYVVCGRRASHNVRSDRERNKLWPNIYCSKQHYNWCPVQSPPGRHIIMTVWAVPGVEVRAWQFTW